MKKLVLIDGFSILHRSYFAMPKLSDEKGRPTGAILGFVNTLQKIIEENRPDYMVVALDEKALTFRHKMYGQYKANRSAMPDDLKSQVLILKELLSAIHMAVFSMEGFEADDIIGSIAKSDKNLDKDVIIVSGDRDLLQLVDDHITMHMPKSVKGKSVIEKYDISSTIEKFKVEPIRIIDLKALMGDASDNIPGVKGVGEKTAQKLLEEYGSLENIYMNIDDIKSKKLNENLRLNRKMADMSYKLATIDTHVPLDISDENMKFYDFYSDEGAYLFFESLNFKKQMANFHLNETQIKKDVELDKSYEIFEYEKNQEILDKYKNQYISIYLVILNEKIKALIFSDSSKSYIFESDDGENYKKLFLKLYSIAKAVICVNFKDLIKYLDLNLDIDDENLDKIYDLSLFSYLINAGLKNTDVTIDSILSDMLDQKIPLIKDIFGKKIDNLMEDEKRNYYAYISAIQKLSINATISTSDILKDDDLWKIYKNIELPLSIVLSDMEKVGIKADVEILKQLSDDFNNNLNELQDAIYLSAGEIFNINSPKQLADILFNKLQIPYPKKNKKNYSTAADILEKLKNDYPIVDNILKFRRYSKLKSTYCDALVEFIKSDGRIHTIFNQNVTATGRLSSTNPNLQNIPVREIQGKKIRKAFTAKEGCIFIDADYSQIELRILADMSKDEALILAYQNDADIHKMTAAAIFHLDPNKVTSTDRSHAKAVNFGIIYGISAFGLSHDIDISLNDAKKFIEKYFDTFPKIKIFLDSLVDFAKDKGYAITNFGRKRYIPELNSSNFMRRSFGERIAMNAPIQGTAADIIKIAMINVYRRLKKEKLKARLILQVHDELLIEAPLEEKDRAEKILSEEMINAVKLKVPLNVDVHSAQNWYDLK